MKQDTDKTTIDLSNEPLEILVAELKKSGVRKYTCINDMGYSQLERNIVEQLTNWQKEKDKQTIDKALSIVKTCKFWFSNEANYPKGTSGYNLAKECEELLNTIEKDIKDC